MDTLPTEDVAVVLFGVVIPSVAAAQLVIVSAVARSLSMQTHRWFVASAVWMFFVVGLCFSSGLSVVLAVSRSFAPTTSYGIVASVAAGLVHVPLVVLVGYAWGRRG